MTQNWSVLARNFKSHAWDSSSILPISREYGLKHLPNLRPEEAIEFVAENMRLFDRNYNTALLLCCPELWSSWTVTDWLTLATRLSPRPLRNEHYETGEFTDIVFLIRWIGIDALAMIHHSDLVSVTDKLAILTYCWVYTPFVLNTVNDRPIGWTDDTECFTALHQAKEKLLLACPSLESAYHTTEEFLDEVKSLFLNYGGDPFIVNIDRHD